MNSIRIKKITIVGVFAALTLVATMFTRIPFIVLPNNGYIHLGDSIILLAGLLFGGPISAFVGAIGSTMSDILGSGSQQWAPATFIIKALMGYVFGTMCYKQKELFTIKSILAIVLSGMILIFGYFIFEFLIFRNTFVPMISLVSNTAQFIASIIVAYIIYFPLKDKIKL